MLNMFIRLINFFFIIYIIYNMGTGNVGTLALIARSGNLENKYFLKNPDITFFKSVYRRYTNFSKFTVLKDSDVVQNFGQTVIYKLDNGAADLLSKVSLQHKITFNASNAYNKSQPPDGETAYINASLVNSFKICANLGTNILGSTNDAINLTIGNNKVFQNSDLYLETKHQLLNDYVISTRHSYSCPPILSYNKSASLITCDSGSQFNYMSLSGGVGGLVITYNDIIETFTTDNFYMMPDFSFNYDSGLAIPLLCLNNHQVNFEVSYKSFSDCFRCTNGTGDIDSDVKATLASSCIAEYIHLDIDEKARFLLNSHEYIIEHVKVVKFNNSESTYSLTGNNSLIKYILLAGDNNADFQMTSGSGTTNKSSSTPSSLNFQTLNIQFNNNSINQIDLPIEVFTKSNIYNYFKGNGRDLTGSDLAQDEGLLVDYSVYTGGSILAVGDQEDFVLTAGSVDRYNIVNGAKIKNYNGHNASNVMKVVNVVGETITVLNLGPDVNPFISSGSLTLEIGKNYGHNNSIGVIPFCIKPTDYTQPTGCVSTYENISNFKLTPIYSNDSKLPMTVFIVGYNIININAGQCQLMS